MTVEYSFGLIAPGSIPRSLLRTFNFEIWKLKCLGACPEDLYSRTSFVVSPAERICVNFVDREIAHPAERDSSHPTVPYGSRWMKEEIKIVTLFDLGNCCRRQA